MTVVPENQAFISVDEYLESELTSDVRREYLAGSVYPRAESIAVHNLIVGNIVAALHSHFRGGPFRVFAVDMKVQLKMGEDTLFYYPDIAVARDLIENAAHYFNCPRVIVEVSSPETRRVDRFEKFLAYQTIPQLETYVLVEEEKVECTAFRRDSGWTSELLTSPEQNFVLANINFRMPVHEIYESTDLLLK